MPEEMISLAQLHTSTTSDTTHKAVVASPKNKSKGQGFSDVANSDAWSKA